jgi:hypothetical protein
MKNFFSSIIILQLAEIRNIGVDNGGFHLRHG